MGLFGFGKRMEEETKGGCCCKGASANETVNECCCESAPVEAVSYTHLRAHETAS